jgi:hypothetical protein
VKLDEVTPVLDVHPPHGPTHGARDFFIHLFTITIGLLIALGLEGCVEWQHHRHLVHEAEAGLHTEISSNEKGMKDTIDDVRKQQESLKHDVVVLNYIIKNHKVPANGSMEITFHIRGFADVSWKTAQSTGALGYMPYERAQEYSEIYAQQDMLATTEQQAARDAIISMGAFMNSNDDDPNPTDAQANVIIEKIGVLQGQLLLVDSLVKSLDGQYKKFLSSHPE